MERLKSEPVRLADGVARQMLVPGVKPVSLTAREIALERERRNARRGHAPAGGMFDECETKQGRLL
jgi:hypothetical protein